MGAKLVDGQEVLFRQIHPDLVQDGEPSSSSFRPKEADDNKLSVDRGSMTTPADAFALYTGNGFKSVAVYGVSVREFEDNGVPCEEDALLATGTLVANPAHALASFDAHGTSKQKVVAKRIKKVAIARGILHDPSAPAAPATGDDNGAA